MQIIKKESQKSKEDNQKLPKQITTLEMKWIYLKKEIKISKSLNQISKKKEIH
jgi:hypothetical protein